MKDGSVKIVCEAEEATLKEFIQAISLKTDFIMVEKVKILRTQPATGEYEFFEIKYGSLEEEMGERLVAAFTIAAATRQDIKNMHADVKEVRGDLKGMHSDIKNMHGELKDVHGELKDMHYDLKDMHQDLKSSINSMHEDMNRHFEEMAKRYDAISAELLRTREELKRSVDTLVELVHKFLEKS
jgi:archaellum component FlaC